jgi:radical SAM protein (TIGR01212 family)
MSPNRFHPLSVYFRRRFGRRVRKIPLDAGSSCPNRDGSISFGGCSFCNENGSGTGQGSAMSLAQQYLAGRERILARGAGIRFLGYIQSFSNTYGPAERLRRMLRELEGLPDLAGIAIGTRPDCLDEEKLDILQCAPFEEVWLDLGLQSAHDRTLRRINRGHDAACFAHWTRRAGERGIRVCAHVITGLPGETLADFEQTMTVVNSLPVTGVKFHNLYICRDTALERDWRAGRVELLTKAESLRWLVRGLELLRPEIVIHRLGGDPAPGELVAPDWALDKAGFLDAARRQLTDEDTWQGKALGLPPAPWFNHEGGHATWT